MTPLDPFALGGIDDGEKSVGITDTPGGTEPLIDLGAEFFRLWAEGEALGRSMDDAAYNARYTAPLHAIEVQIASLTPITITGAAVQLRLLRHRMRVYEWCERDNQTLDHVVAGIERLT